MSISIFIEYTFRCYNGWVLQELDENRQKESWGLNNLDIKNAYVSNSLQHSTAVFAFSLQNKIMRHSIYGGRMDRHAYCINLITLDILNKSQVLPT